ncbi:MAG: ATP-dependent zinc metalloprotease FtsH [Burkholderiales bacterium]|nr:ATP-dependent zinc metalloprotease FtsH [Burkholderiales bacterium]
MWWWFAALVVLNFVLSRWLVPSGETPVAVPYTLFKKEVGANNVAAIYNQGQEISGKFSSPIDYPPPGPKPQPGKSAARQQDSSSTQPQGTIDSTWFDRLAGRSSPPDTPRKVSKFETTLPTFVGPGLERFLIDHGVEISATPISEAGSPFLTLLFGFGPALLIIVFYIWLFRRTAQYGGGMGGALMGIGKSKARRFDEESETKVTFNDVAGIDEAKNELVEIVDFLKAPAKYTRLGGAAPKGVLLVGAPGTGKTLLARAVAGEAAVPFFSMSAAEFVEMIVGVGAARVRDLFKEARASAPAIIFIDELDAIGRARGQIAIGGSSEQEQTLNQILTEMDGFSSREGVIVLAATNQPDVLDKALLRPGRFDRRVIVNLPDKRGRQAILAVHTRTVPLAGDVRPDEIAQSTPGFSGADLKNLVNEAALLAARRGESCVQQKDFSDALEKIVLGPARPILLSEDDRRRIAYHEGGHAILGLVVPGADPVSRVTIVPRGQALGVTYQRPESDRYNYPEAYLRGRIVGMLGGRTAEEIVFGDRTTGAENDIEQATSLARRMVTRWGMSDLGLIQFAPRDNPYLGGSGAYAGAKPFSEQTALAIDTEVARIIDQSHVEATRLLTAHRHALDALAQALLTHESLDEQEVLQVTGLERAAPVNPHARALRARHEAVTPPADATAKRAVS